jgi:hypothetical protein
MSATSNSFWAATEGVRDELAAIAALGADAYVALESNDDPEEVADLMQGILDKVDAMSGRLCVTIPLMRDVAKAFDAMAAVKS